MMSRSGRAAREAPTRLKTGSWRPEPQPSVLLPRGKPQIFVSVAARRLGDCMGGGQVMLRWQGGETAKIVPFENAKPKSNSQFGLEYPRCRRRRNAFYP